MKHGDRQWDVMILMLENTNWIICGEVEAVVDCENSGKQH
jgi:hypothetical protein